MNRSVPVLQIAESPLFRRLGPAIPAATDRGSPAPVAVNFDWLALAFWLSYFGVYSVLGWTMVRVGQCIELWCR